MKKKGLLVSVICFIMLFIITGCGNKKAISTDTFKTNAEGEGFTVTDVQAQYSSYGYINQATVAAKDGYQIEFFVLSDSTYAKSMFDTNKAILENINGNNKTKTEINMSNYNKYTVSTSTNYGYLSRIDNTLIFINASNDKKDDIKKFVKKLGY